MLKNIVMFIGFVTFLCSSNAKADKLLPTNTDLRAAYCIGAKQDYQNMVNETLPQFPPESKESAQLLLDSSNSKLKKLRAYLLPRIPHLDPYGIQSAMASGTYDNKNYFQELGKCMRGCVSGSCVRVCFDQLENKYKNYITCNDLSWLPF